MVQLDTKQQSTVWVQDSLRSSGSDARKRHQGRRAQQARQPQQDVRAVGGVGGDARQHEWCCEQIQPHSQCNAPASCTVVTPTIPRCSIHSQHVRLIGSQSSEPGSAPSAHSSSCGSLQPPLDYLHRSSTQTANMLSNSHQSTAPTLAACSPPSPLIPHRHSIRRPTCTQQWSDCVAAAAQRWHRASAVRCTTVITSTR